MNTQKKAEALFDYKGHYCKKHKLDQVCERCRKEEKEKYLKNYKPSNEATWDRKELEELITYCEQLQKENEELKINLAICKSGDGANESQRNTVLKAQTKSLKRLWRRLLSTKWQQT